MERLRNGIFVVAKDVFVTNGGKVAYRIFLVGLFRRSGLKNGLVPTSIVDQGDFEVEKYVDRLIVKMVNDSDKARRAYRKVFQSNAINLSVKVGRTTLKGVLRPSKGSGQAIFDVELVSPKKYMSRKTLYETRYPYGPLRGLVKENGVASKLAIDEAKEMLVKMYNNKQHREKHSRAYEIVNKVNLTFKEK